MAAMLVTNDQTSSLVAKTEDSVLTSVTLELTTEQKRVCLDTGAERRRLVDIVCLCVFHSKQCINVNMHAQIQNKTHPSCFLDFLL